MGRLARTIGRPALTGLRVSADSVEIIENSVTPSRLPDAFAGVPCVISGRYRVATPGAVLRVDADAPGGPFTTALTARPVPEAVAVRTIWARSVVRDLEDEYAAYRADDELAAQLVAHSVRFGVLSRFTAFVAIDPEKTDAGPLTEVIQPVEEPSGWASNVGHVGFASAGGRYSMSSRMAMPAPAAMMPPPPAGPPPVYAQAGPPIYAGAAPGGAPDDYADTMGGAPIPVPLPAPKKPAAPRPLEKLLKQVEKGTQVRRTGLDAVLAELKQHRDAATGPDLRSALDLLCAALARFLQDPTAPQGRQVLVGIDAVKRALAGQGRPARKRRFWA